ncbi:MAG: AMP-binding protein [Flavobacteriaceae bacterium]
MIPEIDFKSPTEIKLFQEAKLKEVLRYITNNSPFYKRRLKDHAHLISSVNTLEDLVKLPVTTKEDLQQHNGDFLCVPTSKIIDYVTTSGTTGKPVTFALSHKDLDRLAYNEAVSFATAGVTSLDTLQLTTTMDRCFMAGLAYFLGARELGAGIVRAGAGIPALQIESMFRFNPSYLITVPSFVLKIIDYGKSQNIDLNTTSISKIICIGEPIRNQDFSLNVLASKIKERWDVELYSTYASTEMSTAFTECSAHKGGHHRPDLIIVEVLDENNCPVQEGEEGELTITTIGVEAMPLLRFKTGDIVKVHAQPCSCGRNTVRIGPVIGRKKQMIKYKGTTLYPQAISNVLAHYEQIEAFVIELYKNEIDTDEIVIKLAGKNLSNGFLENVKQHFQTALRVLPKIQFCEKEEIYSLQFSKGDRKPRIVIDKR